jgi:hypothetical protein
MSAPGHFRPIFADRTMSASPAIADISLRGSECCNGPGAASHAAKRSGEFNKCRRAAG